LGADLHDDAAYVRQVLDRRDAPVVLLGHSYGGAIITEAGTHPKVAHLIFLASLVPDEGETCGQLLGVDAAGIDDEPKAPPPEPAELFYHDCDEQMVAWAVERLRPRPLTWMQQSPRAVGWRVRPSTYVVCAADRAIPADVQKSWAARCTASIEWDSSHSPFMSHPDWVVELLATTVKSLEDRQRRL
jgi:pimeloyl-ACP methyl ester carboxylesterase